LLVFGDGARPNEAAELHDGLEDERHLGLVDTLDRVAQQVMVRDVVELLLVCVFGLLPFIEVVDFPVSRQALRRLLELLAIANDLRVDVDGARDL